MCLAVVVVTASLGRILRFTLDGAEHDDSTAILNCNIREHLVSVFSPTKRLKRGSSLKSPPPPPPPSVFPGFLPRCFREYTPHTLDRPRPPSRPFGKSSKRADFSPTNLRNPRGHHFPRDKFSKKRSFPVLGTKEGKKEGRKGKKLNSRRDHEERRTKSALCNGVARRTMPRRFPVHRSRIRLETCVCVCVCVSRTDRRYAVGYVGFSLSLESIQLPRSRVNSYASRRVSGSLGHGRQTTEASPFLRSFLFPLDGAEDDPRLNRRIHAVAVRGHTHTHVHAFRKGKEVNARSSCTVVKRVVLVLHPFLLLSSASSPLVFTLVLTFVSDGAVWRLHPLVPLSFFLPRQKQTQIRRTLCHLGQTGPPYAETTANRITTATKTWRWKRGRDLPWTPSGAF